jgi:hypothetical protein
MMMLGNATIAKMPKETRPKTSETHSIGLKQIAHKRRTTSNPINEHRSTEVKASPIAKTSLILVARNATHPKQNPTHVA